MTEVVQEYVDSRGVALRVDRAAGVLRGVKLIGLESLNGRRYRPAALADAVSLYEGAKVNVNHAQHGPLAPRDYRDRLGVIRQVEFRSDDGLFGNLHFNPKHAVAEQLMWDAENNPRNVGFSHNVLARLSREGDHSTVEAITHVQSVDLVADPAATQGLFEEESPAEPRGTNHWDLLTLATLRAQRPELLEQFSAEQGSHLSVELEEAASREKLLRRQLRVADMAAAHGWPAGSANSLAERLGAAFYEALLQATDDRQVEALIAERTEALQQAAALARGGDRPRSSEQITAVGRHRGAALTASEFIEALRRPVFHSGG